MKLIQMNVWHWRLYWPMRRFLEREQPDFILAQEAVEATRYRTGDHYTTSGIVAEGIMSDALQAAGRPFNLFYGVEQQHLGVAILGRQALQQVAVIDIPQAEAIAANPSLRYYQLLHATTIVNGVTVNLLTYHGQLGIAINGNGTVTYASDDTVPGEPRLGNPRSEADFRKIAAYIDGLSGPTILTGDFNLWPQARALEPLHNRLRNLVTTDHMAHGRNPMAWKTEEIVSHCFVSAEIKVLDFHVATDLVSDHQPLVLAFDL